MFVLDLLILVVVIVGFLGTLILAVALVVWALALVCDEGIDE